MKRLDDPPNTLKEHVGYVGHVGHLAPLRQNQDDLHALPDLHDPRLTRPPDRPPGTGAVVLTLRPLPDSIPVATRLRRLLKAALRVWGFRCTSIRPADDRAMESPSVHDQKSDCAT